MFPASSSEATVPTPISNSTTAPNTLGWQQQQDQTVTVTSVSSIVVPLPLPIGWQRAEAQGRPVYINHRARSTQWNHPLAPPTPPPANQPRALPLGLPLPTDWTPYNLEGLVCYRSEQENKTLWELPNQYHLASSSAETTLSVDTAAAAAAASTGVIEDDFVLVGEQAEDINTQVTRAPKMPKIIKMTVLHLLEPDLKTWRKRKAILYDTGALCFYPVRFVINNKTWLEYLQAVSIFRNVWLNRGETAFSPPKVPTQHCAFWTPREISLLTGPQARNEALNRAHEVTYTSFFNVESRNGWRDAIAVLREALIRRMQPPMAATTS